jgi:hypothetical protein
MLGDGLSGHLHGVSRAERGVLPDEGAGRERGPHRVSLMPDDDVNGVRSDSVDRSQDVLEQGEPKQRVEHLGFSASHPGSLAGGEDQGLHCHGHAPW